VSYPGGQTEFVGVFPGSCRSTARSWVIITCNLASSAVNQGAASKGTVNAPSTDIDGDVRPASLIFDIGADEIGALAMDG